MKNLFFLLLILCYQQLMEAQCIKKWEVGDAIGACYFQPIPQSETLNAAAGTVIQFSIRFDDSDKSRTLSSRTCTAASSGRIEPNNPSYEIIFTIDNGDAASFESATSRITSKSVAATPASTNYEFRCGRTGTMWGSRTVAVFIKPGFTIGTISIKAEIKDNTTLPSGDIGSLQDASKSYTWRITNDTRPCPTALVLQPFPPDQNNKWIDPYPQGFVPYVYKCSSGLPTGSTPDYQNKLISESFDTISAAPFFTMDDVVDRTYLPVEVVTADGVAAHLFSQFVGQPATFIVNAANSFEDVHGLMQRAGIERSFLFLGLSVRYNQKCGFSVKQTYQCNGAVIMKATLFKRAFYDGAAFISEIKKSH
jgi:hypothetical protein